jgi:antitoxin component YwqK of YwqJK toxin-antitoxin module
MVKGLFILGLIMVFGTAEMKQYSKNYYINGNLQSEGWMIQNQKTDYWFYYFENGNKKEEGHFVNNKKTKWWVYYNSEKEIIKKTEYKNDFANGLSIVYKAGKVVKAEKYNMGVKTKEWNSLSAYQNDKNK